MASATSDGGAGGASSAAPTAAAGAAGGEAEGVPPDPTLILDDEEGMCPLSAWGAAFAEEARPLALLLFRGLRARSWDGVGISRESYGARETAAMHFCADIATREGLGVEYDRAANMVVSLAGAAPQLPAHVTGSHLDSVPQGGNYDGAAGVVAGLIVLIVLKRRGVVPPRTIKVYAFRGEESGWFAQACKGSAALFGQLREEHLSLPQCATGQTLRDAMAECGADVDAIAAGTALIDDSGGIAAVESYTELHIEQSVALDRARRPVAVVPAIRGLYRFNIEMRGRGDHAGATPRTLRGDAVAAASNFMVAMNNHWKRWEEEEGEDLVWTVGILGTLPGEQSYSRVPSTVRLGVEMRSQSRDTLHRWTALMKKELERACEGCTAPPTEGVTHTLEEVAFSEEAIMDPRRVERLTQLCKERLEVEAPTLNSGAGHDAANWAVAGVPCAMVFVRNQHGSHNPREAMRLHDFLVGTALLALALQEP